VRSEPNSDSAGDPYQVIQPRAPGPWPAQPAKSSTAKDDPVGCHRSRGLPAAICPELPARHSPDDLFKGEEAIDLGDALADAGVAGPDRELAVHQGGVEDDRLLGALGPD
jgi:hypothetical protein